MKVLSIVMTLLLIMSCSDATHVEKVDSNQEVLNFLANDGFDIKEARFEDGYVFVENDISFSVEDLKLRMKQKRDKQWRTQYTVSQSRISDVKIKIDRKLSSAWKADIRRAIDLLNSVGNTKLRVREVSSGQDIYIRARNISYAYGTFPTSDGRPGYLIALGKRINPNTSFWYNTALHEIGHNLGFRHDFAQDEGIDPSQHISGTPYRDYRSMMSYDDWIYMTHYDKVAIRTLYPQ